MAACCRVHGPTSPLLQCFSIFPAGRYCDDTGNGSHAETRRARPEPSPEPGDAGWTCVKIARDAKTVEPNDKNEVVVKTPSEGGKGRRPSRVREGRMVSRRVASAFVVGLVGCTHG